jgi:hypothetical protein
VIGPSLALRQAYREGPGLEVPRHRVVMAAEMSDEDILALRVEPKIEKLLEFPLGAVRTQTLASRGCMTYPIYSKIC